MKSISVIILTKNVENEVLAAIKSVKFANEIIIVDTGSTDNTLSICKKMGAKIVHSAGTDFSKWRNDGAKEAKGEWLLYLDSDERIPVKLAEEIIKTIENQNFSAYTISRYEIFLGAHLKHWGDPRVLRLIAKNKLKKWVGKLHEQPLIDGEIGSLKNQMIHLSHKNIDEKMPNTQNWSIAEASLLLQANHPPMVWWRFIRVMFTEFWYRAVRQGLWKDGTEGWIEIIYQMFSKFIAYERLWEMQQKPTLKQKYDQIDKNILLEWEKKGSL